MEEPRTFDQFGIVTILPYVIPGVRTFNRVNAHIQKYYGIMDVVGDGYCGYYVLGLLTYLRTGQIMDTQQIIDDVRSVYETLIPNYNKIKPNSNHWLDVAEFSMYAYKHKINVCILGEKNGRYEISQTFIYNANGCWAFVKLQGNHHYQLLCAQKDKAGKEYYSLFKRDRAQSIINTGPNAEVLFFSNERLDIQIGGMKTFLNDDYSKVLGIGGKPPVYFKKQVEKPKAKQEAKESKEAKDSKDAKDSKEAKAKPPPPKAVIKVIKSNKPDDMKLIGNPAAKQEKPKPAKPQYDADEEEFSKMLIEARRIVLKIARSK